MDATVSFFSSPKPAIIAAVIAAGGCVTFSFSATFGTGLILAGLGLAISTLAIAIFEIIVDRAGEIKDDVNSRNYRALRRLNEDTSPLSTQIRTMNSQLQILAS